MHAYAYNKAMDKTVVKPNPIQALEDSFDTELFKVLSEPARITLIKLLLRQPNADIGALAAYMSQDRSVVSRHLKAMHQAGLVTRYKSGKFACYCLNGDAFVEKLEQVLKLVRQATDCDCC